MAAGLSPEDAVFVLEADDVHVVEVQEVGGGLVGVQVLLLDLEADPLRVPVALLDIGYGDGEALDPGVDGREGFADIVSKGGYPALPGEVVADEGDFFDVFHDGFIISADPDGGGDGAA